MATVNLDCKLDLKTIAFHARNVEYNPKVRRNPKKIKYSCFQFLLELTHIFSRSASASLADLSPSSPPPLLISVNAAFRGGNHAHPSTQDDSVDIQFG